MKAFSKFAYARVDTALLNKVKGGITEAELDAVLQHLYQHNHDQYLHVLHMARSGMIQVED